MPQRVTRPHPHLDTIVVGSGFGGALAARELVAGGERVVMLERGDWVRRGPAAWEPEATATLSSAYDADTAYDVHEGGRTRTLRALTCVGGPSVFYGGVALRLRAGDLTPPAAIAGPSGLSWPFGYRELAPCYDEVERLLDVAGQAGADPSEPPRSGPYPQRPAPLHPVSSRLAAAAAELGLTPFPLPLALNHRPDRGRPACTLCDTCDTFACAIGAKNDLATAVLPRLLEAGLTLRTGVQATRLVARRGRIVGVECVDRRRGRREVLLARRVVLAAGALESARLVLASGLARHAPAPEMVGANLVRHCSAIVYGVFGRPVPPGFHKQLGIHDLYAGDPAAGLAGPLGVLQQMPTPPGALVQHHLPPAIGRIVRRVSGQLTGLLAMAEDQPSPANRVRLHPAARDAAGVPRLVVEHQHTARDLAARAHLVDHARRVLRAAGALGCYVHPIETFSHAAGTLRMGSDLRTSVLDADGAFRGVEGLHVVDGAALPTTGAVNPSLTIAANGLRIGAALAGRQPTAVTLADAA
jgi:choline dehydrogenase-like flavoprotein